MPLAINIGHRPFALLLLLLLTAGIVAVVHSGSSVAVLAVAVLLLPSLLLLGLLRLRRLLLLLLLLRVAKGRVKGHEVRKQRSKELRSGSGSGMESRRVTPLLSPQLFAGGTELATAGMLSM
jgi:membrane protein implicated in regulation of membrane protease activity